MKIISWNLKNLGSTKLNNKLTTTFQNYGLGNTVLDYMIGVVMGNPIWNNVNTPTPADIFVIIELKSGGYNKGKDAFGTARPTLATVVNAMNTYATGFKISANYHYDAVPPLIVGYHETVGIIFNTKQLTFDGTQAVNNQVLRDNNNRLINPRTPYSVRLKSVQGGANLQVIGIHAPPPKGADSVKYRPPIQYANKVATVPQLTQADTLIMGDYNCSPNSVFNSGFGNTGWQFNGYNTLIPDGTLTSVRRKLGPNNEYLSGPYDNLLKNFSNSTMKQLVLDTIGNARNFSTNPVGTTNPSVVLSNFNKVSDHLAITLY